MGDFFQTTQQIYNYILPTICALFVEGWNGGTKMFIKNVCKCFLIFLLSLLVFVFICICFASLELMTSVYILIEKLANNSNVEKIH